MKRILRAITLAATIMIVFAGCSDTSNNVWDDMPQSIAQFMSRYFPERGISKFVEDDGSYLVTVKNGPSIIFDSSRQWVSINGNGETMPQVFLFDELPPALYSFLQDMEDVDGVYKVTRRDGVYELTLESTIVRYDTATGILTHPYD